MISFKHTRITRYCESQNESMECVYVCPTWCFSFFVRLWQNKWLSCNAFLHCFCQSSKLWIIPSYSPFLVSPQCTIRFEQRLSELLNWLKLLIFSHFFILRSTLQFIKTIFVLKNAHAMISILNQVEGRPSKSEPTAFTQRNTTTMSLPPLCHYTIVHLQQNNTVRK